MKATLNAWSQWRRETTQFTMATDLRFGTFTHGEREREKEACACGMRVFNVQGSRYLMEFIPFQSFLLQLILSKRKFATHRLPSVILLSTRLCVVSIQSPLSLGLSFFIQFPNHCGWFPGKCKSIESIWIFLNSYILNIHHRLGSKFALFILVPRVRIRFPHLNIYEYLNEWKTTLASNGLRV